MTAHEDPAALRDRMLDAAEAVVVQRGIGNLTLDAVAAACGMSKGGLLHHFPTKDRLIEGMVRRCADHWRECALGSVESVPDGPGRMARALLRHLDDAEGWTDQCRQSSCAVFAALAQNPNLIEPMRAVYADIRARLRADGLPPGAGEAITAAMDGLWLCRVLGLATVDQALMRRVRKALERLLESPSPRRAADRTARSQRAPRRSPTKSPGPRGPRGGR